MFSDEEIEARVLLKLFKRGKWGGAHTSIDNIKKGWSIRNLGREGLKRVDRAVRKLIKNGFLLSKPTSYGLQVSLNPHLSREIREIMQEFYSV